jgi:hypothetical protein
MQFQRVNRTNAEKSFGVLKNVAGTTLYGNYPASFTTGVGSADGYGVVSPATGSLATFAGIVDVDIADTGVGLYQCYGVRDSVRLGSGNSLSITADTPVGPLNGKTGLTSVGVQWTMGPVITMESVGAVIMSGGGYAACFIRAL